MPPLNGKWLMLLKSEFKKPYYKKLFIKIKNEYLTKKIFPASSDIFNAFHMTKPNKIKVVILGQDPYCNDNQAHGLCFSVKPNIKIPPSMMNIYKELKNDCGCYIPNNGYLKKWAKNGVFLLNTILTVRAYQINSHKNIGWEIFTNKIISILNNLHKYIVFFLWGKLARSKKNILNNPMHLVLEASHPSPLSANNGFFGCKHFSKANNFLIKHNIQPIDWQIENI